MSGSLMVALVEDDKGRLYQFQSVSDADLNAQIAAWVRPRWREDFGTCPEDDGDCIEVYFENMSGPPFVAMGFEHTLKVIDLIDPIDLSAFQPEAQGTPRSYLPSVLLEVAGTAHYPMEIFVNGELSFKLDSEDAEGDLKAIRALMEIRTRTRQNKPLTNMELYGSERPEDIVFRSADGETKIVRPDWATQPPSPSAQKWKFITDPDEIDDMIDRWHADPEVGGEPVFKCDLHEALGWTWEQYKRWVETSVIPTVEWHGHPREERQP
jgi:hypothetical protein